MSRKPKRATAPERAHLAGAAHALLGDADTPSPRSLLRPLGIVGYDAAEPALLAALATDAPLLLVSDHGAAKSLLLERLAQALGLGLRHYNASLLQYDDLVGFPIPLDDGTVKFAAPPGAIWGAEAVFLDEIGRCRPDVANKLFPIVHERRVQGIRLDSLRCRWAATNPPAEAVDTSAGGDPEAYAGVEPLDAALADRFDWVVALPRFEQLSDRDRATIVAGIAPAVDDDARTDVQALVAATRDLVPVVDAMLGDALTQYVVALASALHRAHLAVGGRRAATLRRNLVAGWAAHLALGRATGEKALATVLRGSIPDRVRRVVPDATLVAAHLQAWQLVTVDAASPEAVLAGVTDPARRAILAATLPGLTRVVRGETISHAIAAVAPRLRPLLAWLLLRRHASTGELPAATLEVLADLIEPVVRGGTEVRGFGTSATFMTELRSALAVGAPSRLVGGFLLNCAAVAESALLPLDGFPTGKAARDMAATLLGHHAEWCRALGMPLGGDALATRVDAATAGPNVLAREASATHVSAQATSHGAVRGARPQAAA
jgi:MoxR-like ATPase